MSASTVENKSLTMPAKSRRLRFGLATMLVLIGLFAIVLSRWFYYRPLALTFYIQMAVVDAPAAKSTLAAHSANSIEGSPVVWFVLDDQELSSLFVRDGKAAEVTGGSYPRAVSDWPVGASIADGHTEARGFPLRDDPSTRGTAWELCQLGGWAGCRLENRVPQLRLKCQLTCREPVASNFEDLMWITVEEAKILYEGEVPRGHLVFMVPVGEDVFHVVVFDFK